jgi:hypothetical protein
MQQLAIRILVKNVPVLALIHHFLQLVWLHKMIVAMFAIPVEQDILERYASYALGVTSVIQRLVLVRCVHATHMEACMDCATT